MSDREHTPAWRATLLVGLSLLVLVAFSYAQVRDHGFVNFDDGKYIFENRNVRQGLTWSGVEWACTTCHASNWHPLTWASHMLDVQLFGLDPGAHHLVSVALHGIGAILLFAALLHLTAAPWRSAAVAAFFALHPLRVESVAWAAERKDVLSGVFFMLTLLFYSLYAARPGRVSYLLVVATLALGLTAKPMLVTLPFLLLLLDIWPLGRWKLPGAPPRRLVLEKLPLVALAAASSAVTIACQKRGGAVAALDNLPVVTRLANGVVAYVAYLWKTIWPVELAFYYPHPTLVSSQPFDSLVVPGFVAAVLLAGVTVLAFRLARSRPYVALGWFWYLGTLVPVVGLIQVGSQAMADRYAYLPLVGIYIAVVWAAGDFVQRRPRVRPIVAGVCVLLLVGCMTLTRKQVTHWRDSRSLFEHALRVTTGNALAHNNLGTLLAREGDVEQARIHYEEAVRIKPDYANGHKNLGLMYARQNRLDEAEQRFQRALELHPDFVEAHVNLGVLYGKRSQFERAESHLRRALELQPDYPEGHLNLGAVLYAQGKLDEAAVHATALDAIAADHSGAGELAAAIHWQTKALQLASAEMQEEMRSRLEAYRRATLSQPGSAR